MLPQNSNRSEIWAIDLFRAAVSMNHNLSLHGIGLHRSWADYPIRETFGIHANFESTVEFLFLSHSLGDFLRDWTRTRTICKATDQMFTSFLSLMLFQQFHKFADKLWTNGARRVAMRELCMGQRRHGNMRIGCDVQFAYALRSCDKLVTITIGRFFIID